MIKLNLDTELKFKVVSVQLPELVSRVVYSPEQERFIDIEARTSQGYVEVTTDTDEHTATVDGVKVYGELSFALELVLSPDGGTGALWDVYSFWETPDDDIDLTEVSTSEIPECIVDMLPPSLV